MPTDNPIATSAAPKKIMQTASIIHTISHRPVFSYFQAHLLARPPYFSSANPAARGHAPARACLLDHLVRAQHYRWGYGKAKHLGGLAVQDHLEFCWELHR